MITQFVSEKVLPWTPRAILLADLVSTDMGSMRILVANILAVAIMEDTDIPTVREWLSKVRFMGTMAKITAICRNRAGNVNAISDFIQHWGVFMLSKYLGFSQSNTHAQVLAALLKNYVAVWR